MAATTATATFDAQARTSDRRNGPCRVSAPQRTAPEDGKGRSVGSTPRSPARSTSFSTMMACRSSVARSLIVSLASGHRSESSGALWSRSLIPCRSSRSSTPVCRRWWTRWWKCWRFSTTLCLTSTRSSKCPRSVCTRSHPARIHRQPRAVKKILGKAEVVAVVDVLVSKQLKLQMSSPVDSGRRLRVPSSTVCWTSCFATKTDTNCANRAADWRFHSAVLCWLLPRPFLCNDRCLVDVRVNMLDKFQ